MSELDQKFAKMERALTESYAQVHVKAWRYK